MKRLAYYFVRFISFSSYLPKGLPHPFPPNPILPVNKDLLTLLSLTLIGPPLIGPHLLYLLLECPSNNFSLSSSLRGS